MCYFITIMCDSEHSKSLRGILRSSFGAHETQNRSIVSGSPTNWSAFHLAQGMCACDLYREYKDEGRDFEAKIEKFRARHEKPKYRKQGWNDNKIEKTVEQMRLDWKQRQQIVSVTSFTGMRGDLRNAIGEVVKLAGEAAVIVHWYSGSTENEDFHFTVSNVSLCDFVTGKTVVGTDVLYFVK